jgi:hypothetical protein
MSKYNIVNPDLYKVAGRLRPDEAARERGKQARSAGTSKIEKRSAKRSARAPGRKRP